MPFYETLTDILPVSCYFTPSFVNVHYNDGTTTQQFVEWEPLSDEAFRKTQKEGTVIVDGRIKGLPKSLLKGQKATLIITVK